MLVADQVSRLHHIDWRGSPEPPHPLVEKLSRFVSFDEQEIAALKHLSRHSRKYRADEILIHQDSRPSNVCLMLSGTAYRYRYLTDGRRQIFGYLLPGDLCDPEFVVSCPCDHNVALLCDSEVAMIATSELMSVLVTYPKIERALLMTAIVEAAILREWLLNVGQRDAIQKLAHFLCEISARLEAIGSVNEDGSFSVPMTQSELADTIGMTPVHVNRSLQRLRHDGVAVWSRRRLVILNRQILEIIAGFDGSYLHLRAAQAEPRLCAYG